MISIRTALICELAIGLATLSSSAFAATSTCSVVDANLNATFTSLQTAVNAARTGDTLLVSGTCVGFTEISQSLIINGQGTKGNAIGTLDGNGTGVVLTIDAGVVVVLNNLVITRGAASHGAGIYNSGTATLNNVTVTGNTAASVGGGIFNNGGIVFLNDSRLTNNSGVAGGAIATIYGSLTISGMSSIDGNTASVGAGIAAKGTNIVFNDKSVVSGNTAQSAAGVDLREGGSLTMNGSSSVSKNTATGNYLGGAILVVDTLVTMNDQSSIVGNISECSGAGIGAVSSMVTMNGRSSIKENVATTRGGGGVANLGGTFTMTGKSAITGNKSGNVGGGILNENGGSVLMSGSSSITANKTVWQGGGVYNGISTSDGFFGAGSTLTMSGKSLISGNVATYGGGVFNSNYLAYIGILNNAVAGVNVINNSPDDIFTGNP
jgi:hypothetical protein